MAKNINKCPNPTLVGAGGGGGGGQALSQLDCSVLRSLMRTLERRNLKMKLQKLGGGV